MLEPTPSVALDRLRSSIELWEPAPRAAQALLKRRLRGSVVWREACAQRVQKGSLLSPKLPLEPRLVLIEFYEVLKDYTNLRVTLLLTKAAHELNFSLPYKPIILSITYVLCLPIRLYFWLRRISAEARAIASI